MTPEPMPLWTDGTLVLNGPVTEFSADAAPQKRTLRHVTFDQAHVTGVEVPLDGLTLSVGWSEFDDCTFTQSSKRQGGEESQGSFASRPSIYRRCVFMGVRFRVRAGFSVGSATFEDCLFEQCKFEEHFSFCADYVNCRFVGPMKMAVFYGTGPDGDPRCPGRRNTLAGNDFSATEFTHNVAWRGGVDLAAQRWPTGYEPVVDEK